MLLTPFAADADDAATKSFVSAYQEKFGDIPNQFAADAYDAIYIIKAAAEKAGCLSWLENRRLIEYQAEETDRFNIRLQIFPAASPPVQGKMIHVFQGIFTYEVTLFYGEQAEYEIYKEPENEQAIASGALTAEISCGAEPSSQETDGKEEAAEGGIITRYQAINRLLEQAEAEDGALGSSMMAYGKKVELLERLFRLL